MKCLLIVSAGQVSALFAILFIGVFCHLGLTILLEKDPTNLKGYGRTWIFAVLYYAMIFSFALRCAHIC